MIFDRWRGGEDEKKSSGRKNRGPIETLRQLGSAKERREHALKTRAQFAFGSNLPLLVEFGFLSIPEDADFDFGSYQKYLEKEKGEQFEKLRRLSECLANAEYLPLLVERGLITSHISPPLKKEDIQSENLLPDDYSAPATMEITFKYSDALYSAALAVGFTKSEIAKINDAYGDDDTPTIMAPKNFRQLNRCEDTRLMFAFALSDEDYTKSQIRGEDAFVKKEMQKFAKRLAHSQITNIVAHGWTGGKEMAVTQDKDHEMSPVESFYANLTPDEQMHAVCISMDGVGMGDNEYTNDVTVTDGFGPSDYAAYWADVTSSLGLFHDDGVTKTIYKFTGHSMGGGMLAHIATSYTERLRSCSRAKNFIFELFNPAVIYQTDSGKIVSTHRWADETLTDDLLEKAAAALVRVGSLGLKQVGQTLGPVYTLSENLVTEIVTKSILLTKEGRYLQKLVNLHIKNSKRKTYASAASAIGSKYDEVIPLQKIREIFLHDDKIKIMNVSSDEERMVNPMYDEIFGVFKLRGCGHYGWKRRDQQHIVNAIQNFYFRHSASEIRMMTALARSYDRKRQADGNILYVDFQQSPDFKTVLSNAENMSSFRQINKFVEQYGQYFDFAA